MNYFYYPYELDFTWVEVFVEDLEYNLDGIRFIYFGPKVKAEEKFPNMEKLDDKTYNSYQRFLDEQ